MDPDLESLRGDPRFEALQGEFSDASGGEDAESE
jgi:hypothetical protein